MYTVMLDPWFKVLTFKKVRTAKRARQIVKEWKAKPAKAGMVIAVFPQDQDSWLPWFYEADTWVRKLRPLKKSWITLWLWAE